MNGLWVEILPPEATVALSKGISLEITVSLKEKKKKNLIQLVLDPRKSNQIDLSHISLLAHVAGAKPR